ncbi:MAG: FKBP-type peptidyl-prolyl cis-trans isomerase [Gammaproteobacteria bacterium]|nr:FKBP-type peptidyl-prolyl cis-trans isomerase [Gammaproteobacteria bacterium]MCK5262193.1 FKBP-type peptidyl-prolyl cis-trans isomerase [Gammaproteobacteria bacterium]
MRSSYLLALAFVLPIISCAADHSLDTLEKKASYSIGVDFINRMQAQNAEIDVDAFIRGISDASSGKETAMTQPEMTQTIKDFQQHVTELRQAKQKELASKNIEAGKAFLATNASNEGVITTESGLQYKIIKEGTGDSPKLEDTVVTNYEGRLIDGQVFDSSYKRKQPATFPVKGVIKGWTEALQLMKTGAKWQLFVPADIAYGASQRGKLIQANSTLIFDIELLEIKAAK